MTSVLDFVKEELSEVKEELSEVKEELSEVKEELSEVKDSLKDCLAALNRFDDDSYFHTPASSFRYLKDDTHDQRKDKLEKEKDRVEKRKDRLEKKQDSLNKRLLEKLKQAMYGQGTSPQAPAPSSPIQSSTRSKTAPPSTGRERLKVHNPVIPPSLESVDRRSGAHLFLSDGGTRKNFMQCTSHPIAIALTNLLYTVEDGPVETEYCVAANHIIQARESMPERGLSIGIKRGNERFFTGAFATALGSVLDKCFSVLHQGCIGHGTAHSDISVCYLENNQDWPPPLLVGEGKISANIDLREETRGQIVNELLRHRTIYCELNKKPDLLYYGPILLLSMDYREVNIDIVFPSRKGGKLEMDGALSFATDDDEETFWTLQLLRTRIWGTEAEGNLPRVLKFLSSALALMATWQSCDSFSSRVQSKIPIPVSMTEHENGTSQFEISESGDLMYYNKNVSRLCSKEGVQYIFKEYCYHLRQERKDTFLFPHTLIDANDQRKPPPKDLLNALGAPYNDWEIHEMAFGSVLQYPFIEGNSDSPSVRGWIQIIRQLKKIHNFGYVHGDILQRNLIFDHDKNGYIIDFDLTKKENETYVRGFNYEDFKETRHPEARENQTMKKIHDVHSLIQLSKQIFYVRGDDFANFGLDELLTFFEQKSHELLVENDSFDDEIWIRVPSDA